MDARERHRRRVVLCLDSADQFVEGYVEMVQLDGHSKTSCELPFLLALAACPQP